MKKNVFLRIELAKFVEQRDIVSASALLHDHAEQLMERSEQAVFDCASRETFEERIRRLVEAVAAIPDLVKVEEGIADELKKITELDVKLLLEAEQLQTYIALCAEGAELLSQVGRQDHAPYPDTLGRPSPIYITPLGYLKSFANNRPATAYHEALRNGRPWLHSVIEMAHYDDRLVHDIASTPEWEQYFLNCLRYFRELYQDIQIQLPVRDLLEISKKLASLNIDWFRDDKAISLLAPIREIYSERERIKSTIDEKLEQIDHFYACLSSCEQNLFLEPLKFPLRNIRYSDKPLIGNFPR